MANRSDPRDRLAELWDTEIRAWLQGRRDVSDELRPWFGAYRGSGEGAVNLEPFPEPFLGDLFATPKAVFLALNPGPVYEEFQYAGGFFVQELEREGYTSWAARWRYLDEEKPRVEGGLRFHGKRLKFLRRWYGDSSLSGDSMLAFELYPWHSQKLNAPFRWSDAALRLVREYVWEPIAASGAEYVFGVGADFHREFESLGTEILGVLGDGGEPAAFTKRRRVTVARSAPGVIALGMNNFNQAAPPNEADTAILKEALHERGWIP